LARRWRRMFIVTAAGFLILLAAVALGRLWIAEQLVVAALESEGLGPARVTVTGLGPNGIALADLDAGGHAGARTITVIRNGWDIVDWEVRIEHLTVTARYGDDGLTFGPINLYGASEVESEENASRLPELPRLTVRSLEAELTLPDGLIRFHDATVRGGGRSDLVEVSGRIEFQTAFASGQGTARTTGSTAGTARIEAVLDRLTSAVTGAPIAAEAITIEGDLQPDFIDLRLNARLPSTGVEVAMHAAVAGPFDQPFIDVTGYVEATDIQALRTLLPVAPDASGEARIGWRASGGVNIGLLLSEADVVRAFTGEVGTQIEGDLSATPGIAGPTTFDLTANGQIADGQLTAEISSGAAQIQGLHAALIPAAIGVNGSAPLVGDLLDIRIVEPLQLTDLPLSALLNGTQPTATVAGSIRLKSMAEADVSFSEATLQPGSIRITNMKAALSGLKALDQKLGDISFGGDARLDGQGIHLDGVMEATAVRLARDDMVMRNAHLRLPVTVSGDLNSTRATVKEATLAAGSFVTPGGISSGEPTRVRFNAQAVAGGCSMTACDTIPESVSLNLSLQTARIDLADVGDVELSAANAQIDLKDISTSNSPDLVVRADIQRARSSRFGTVTGLAIHGKLRSDLTGIDLTVGTDRIDAKLPDAPSLPAMQASGTLFGSIGEPQFEGQVQLLATGLPPALIEATKHTARVSLTEMSVSGLVALEAASEWLPDGLSETQGAVSVSAFHTMATGVTRLDLNLTDVGATTEVGSFRGLNSAFRLISLDPPVSAGRQTLALDMIEAGTALSNLTATLEVGERNGAPVVLVHGLSGDLFGGGMRFDPVTIDGGDTPPELVLRLDQLSLQELTGLTGLQDFALEGSVSGVIPFAIDRDNRVAIRDGILTADRPGVMRLNLDSIGDALSQQMGDQAGLLLDALRNFQYSTLEARISKPFDANEETGIKLAGRNPDHLEGQPFVFNINVNSNVVRLADTILGLYRATLGEVQALARKAQVDP
jgi:hypothetical protein